MDRAAPIFWEDEDHHLRWNQALRGREAHELCTDELKPLVEGGMPLKHRLQLWPHWFQPRPVSGEQQTQVNVPSDIERQIDLDVPRTGPRWLGSSDHAKLSRVLRAFAVSHPDVGYCQGLNNIAAVFLVLGLDESLALKGLSCMVETHCPGYFEPGLKGYMRDVPVIGALVRDLLPDVHSRLLALMVPLDVLASTHFLSLTACDWPLVATVELWDLIFLEGQPAVFASFLALLQLYLPVSEEQASLGEVLPGMADEAPDPVSGFRQAIRRGVAENHRQVIRRVRELLPRISQAEIDRLRVSS
jgi:hypothetical protein